MTLLYGTNPIAWSNDDDQSLGADISLEQCLSEAGEIGFDIEKGHKMPNDGPALKAALGAHVLRFVGGWYSTNLLTRSVEAEKETAQAQFAVLFGERFLKAPPGDVHSPGPTRNS